MTTVIPARPTTYKGIKMRSRLEARYAAELDRIGQAWTYEPRAYADSTGQFLPDFEVHLEAGTMFVEVRPTVTKGLQAMGQIEIIWSSEPDAILAIDIPDKLAFIRLPGGSWECFDRYRVFGDD